MVLVVITGASGSGKSTIAANLAKMINAVIIPQDSFYTVQFNNHPYTIADDIDVEGPELINWERLCTTLITVMTVLPTVNVIVEGHHVFSCDILVEIADVLVFLDTHRHIVKKRFMDRYSESHTNEQLALKDAYFENHTWPNHEKYVAEVVIPTQLHDSDKSIMVEADLERGTNEILDYLRKGDYKYI